MSIQSKKEIYTCIRVITVTTAITVHLRVYLAIYMSINTERMSIVEAEERAC